MSRSMVGPNQVVDIKWNDVKKRGDFRVKNGILRGKKSHIGKSSIVFSLFHSRF